MIFNLIILFAAFSALNLSIYFVIRSFREFQSLYLALANLFLSFCLIIYALEVSHFILDYPHLIWTQAPILFTIGPLYLFAASKNSRKYWWLHMLIFFIMILWVGPFYFQSTSEKLKAFTDVHSNNEGLQPMSYLYLLHIGIYCYFSFLNFQKQYQVILSKSSNTGRKRSLWLKSQSAKIFAINGITTFFVCLLLDYYQLYTLDVKKYTLTMVVLFLIGSHLFISFIIYGDKARGLSTLFLPNEKTKFQDSFKNRFRRTLIEEKRFLSNELTLESLAQELNSSRHALSAYINQEYQVSFNHLINQLRTEEFKKRVSNPENRKYTIFAVAQECGFSSNSSFHRVFKSQEGKTPSQYMKENSALS